MIDKKEVKGIKTFLAKKKPKEFKVFQFTKEMLPEINEKSIKLWHADCRFNPKIRFNVNKTWVECLIKIIDIEGDEVEINFEVGDYIGKDEEGNYFVIQKKEFENNWVIVK